MAAFPNETFYAPGQSYYLRSSVPIDIPSPLDVVETGTNTFKTEISTSEQGGGIVGLSSTSLMLQASSVTLASVDMFSQTATGENIIGFNVGQVGPPANHSLAIDNLYGIQAYLPLKVYDVTLPQVVSITSSNIHGALGSDIGLATSNVVLNSNVVVDQNSTITSTKAGGGVVSTLTPADLTFSNASGTAKVGVNGSVAYFGYGTAPVSNPAISVDSNQSALIQFSDGTNKGTMEQSGSNIIIGPVSVPNAISIAPSGQVDIPNLTYPSTINTTTLNAVYGNFTSNISVADLSANFIYSPTISSSNVTAIGSVNATALNSNVLSSSNMIEYQATPSSGIATAGAVGVWLAWLTIPVSANLIKYPTMDFHMPPMNIDSANLPNFNWAGAIGVIGSNMGAAPITYKTYSGINGYTGFGGGGTTKDQVNGSCYILRQGIDYDTGTTDFIIYIQGNANNPTYNVLAGASNVMMRAYPF